MRTAPTMVRAAILLMVSLAGCSHARSKKSDFVWPLPPEKPRIRFVDAFTTGADLDRSRWARFKRALFGGGEMAIAQPLGLAISDDGARLYIADVSRGAVLRADLDDRTLEPFAPKAALANAAAVAVDAKENVYITDPKKHVVTVVTREGERLREIGLNDLVRPLGLAIDRARGLLYVVDTGNQKDEGHRVLVYDLDGHFQRDLAPQGEKPGRGDLEGQFQFPTYIALDGAGNVYVADTMNFRVQVFDPSGKFLRAFGHLGDGPGTFSRLKGLAFDRFGNLYAVDADHASVQIFNSDFDLLMYFGGPAPFIETMDMPGAIAISPKTNRIYVAMQGTPRVNVYQLLNTTAEDSRAPASPVAPAKSDAPAKADAKQ